MNLMLGLASGCRILPLNYVIESIERRKWLEENDYFASNLFDVIERVEYGGGRLDQLFNQAGKIFVTTHVEPPRRDILRLIRMCGAEVWIYFDDIQFL